MTKNSNQSGEKEAVKQNGEMKKGKECDFELHCFGFSAASALVLVAAEAANVNVKVVQVEKSGKKKFVPLELKATPSGPILTHPLAVVTLFADGHRVLEGKNEAEASQVCLILLSSNSVAAK